VTRTAIPLTDPIAQAWIDWSEQERVPHNTIRRRRTVLRAVGNPGTTSREEIEAWWRTRTHLADSSRSNELAVLRAFYTWCQVWDHRADNPTVRIKPPPAAKGAPRPATRREWHLVLNQVAEDPPMRRGVHLGAWAGLRCEEAARLDWADIDPESRRARVTGKGRKTRIVKFSKKLMAELLPEDGTAPLAGNVVTGKQKGWSADWFGRRVNAAIHAAGVDCTFHKLRHRYGTLGYQHTKDPKALAEQMGHASVATTMTFYAAAADEAADAIADAVADDD
jgi:integrase/recombinase XerC